MRSRMIAVLVLALPFVFAASAARADTPFRPAVLVRMKAIDELVGDLRSLAKTMELEEEGKQLEALLKSRTGPKGIEGLDPKKPLGLYATVDSKLDQSKVVLLLPIADEKAFLAFLAGLEWKAEKGKDDVYTVQIENVPFPVMFRFSDGYLYGTAKITADTTLPARDKLPAPASLLSTSPATLALTIHVDAIPLSLRKMAVSYLSLQMSMRKDEAPEATVLQKKLIAASTDEAVRVVKGLIEDGRQVAVQLDLDRKTQEVTLGMQIEGQPDSKLSKDLASLVAEKSLAAALGDVDAVMGGMIHFQLPASVRKALGPVVDELVKEQFDKLDANVKDLIEPAVKTLLPSAKAGLADLAVDMRGPGKSGKYTLLASLEVQKGAEIEKALKSLADQLPEDARAPFKFDVDKAAGVNIHQVAQKDMDARTRELFGEGPLFVAIRDDAILLAFGEQALDLLKSSAGLKATQGQPARMQLSLARLAPLMAKDQKAAPDVAKRVFKAPGSDRMTMTVTSGKRLEIKATLKTAVLAFAAILDREKNKGESDK